MTSPPADLRRFAYDRRSDFLNLLSPPAIRARNKKSLCAHLTQVKNIEKHETNSEQEKNLSCATLVKELEKSDQEER
jgi:hypothetical protein